MFFRFTSLVVVLALTGDAVAFPVHAGRPSAPIVATLWGWSPWFQGAGILAAIAWVAIIRAGTLEIDGDCSGAGWNVLGNAPFFVELRRAGVVWFSGYAARAAAATFGLPAVGLAACFV